MLLICTTFFSVFVRSLIASLAVHHLLFCFSVLLCVVLRWSEKRLFCVFGSGKSEINQQKVEAVEIEIYKVSLCTLFCGINTRPHHTWMGFISTKRNWLKNHLCLKRCEFEHEFCESLLRKGSEMEIVVNFLFSIETCHVLKPLTNMITAVL